jgi:hypothetical protein
MRVEASLIVGVQHPTATADAAKPSVAGQHPSQPVAIVNPQQTLVQPIAISDTMNGEILAG